jgi:hypothetical protein
VHSTGSLQPFCSRLRLPAWMLVPALLATFAGSAAGDSGPQKITLRGAEPLAPSIPTVFDGDLRRLPRRREWRPGDPIKEIPRRHHHPPRITPPGSKPQIDPLLAAQARAPQTRSPQPPILNFAGQGFAGAFPPDTVGDVGIDHYVQMVNSAGGAVFAVYDKSNGSLVAGPIALDSLGTGVCANGLGDGVVLYDQLADRWLLSEISTFGNTLCVYVSKTSNPITGGWFAYQFYTPDLPDYPKYGVWPDAYYAATNESNPTVYAFNRAQMLAGGVATAQRFTAPPLDAFGFQALIPADADGLTPPPAGAPNPFLRHRDDEAHDPGANDPARDFLEIWEFHVDFATPANSSFTGPTNVPVAEFDSGLCGFSSFSCFPEPGGPTLDPLREVVMHRLQYRNFGTYQTLVGNFVTDVDGTDHGGIRWFELRQTSGGWGLYQEGTFAPDAHHRWMGSAAMDGAGNLAVGYSVSSATLYPGIRYTARQPGDPLGTLQGETAVVAGAAAHASNRWGDYSALSVDPVDDRTFWFTTLYTPTSLWATRIATFRLYEATPPLGYFAVTPCRLVDTRNPAGPAGGPALQPAAQRAFILTGSCGVPAGAKALSVNLTVTQPTAAGHLTLFPSDVALPFVSSINFAAGQTRANNAIVVLGHDGSSELKVFNAANGTVHFILDVNGYFVE